MEQEMGRKEVEPICSYLMEQLRFVIDNLNYYF